MNKKKLFIFPHAIGGASSYINLEKQLNHLIKVKRMEYPGHGSRFKEKLMCSIKDMADDAYVQIKDSLESGYCLLGYSMGGLVCYELYHRIKKDKKRLPDVIFLMGVEAPCSVNRIFDCDNMKMEQAIKILKDMNATPNAILDNKDMMLLLFDLVKNDYKAIEYYEPTDCDIGKIESKVLLIHGSKEENLEKSQMEWSRYTSTECNRYIFNGDHFFLFGQENSIAKLISDEILNYGKVCEAL
ncbi:thioesterase II family protein [Anaerocolumna xylanovorans]|uniref:Surfactin synthase thioesterase subunit n=1 Tax=Anaerocolumna xylanovorans DSM 12503 TaxID=1121345 RepID=A0A1M7YI99_9FIRM|nr:thioesterase domain-containing protein [Anaerocolumna xylanovorans]SHO52362.1 Surfactin synthase thioesterase subunit [Anaerocolumna xylanovorans DSM 12503]